MEGELKFNVNQTFFDFNFFLCAEGKKSCFANLYARPIEVRLKKNFGRWIKAKFDKNISAGGLSDRENLMKNIEFFTIIIFIPFFQRWKKKKNFQIHNFKADLNDGG